jgi:hypothetical protein
MNAPVSPEMIPACVAAAAVAIADGEGVIHHEGPSKRNPLDLDFGAMNGEYTCGRMRGVIDGFVMTMTNSNGKAFVYHLCVGKVDGEPMIEARAGSNKGKAAYCINNVLLEQGIVQPSKLFWTDLRPHKKKQPYVWVAVKAEVEVVQEAEGDVQVEEPVHVGLWVPELHREPEPVHVGLWVPEIHHDKPIQRGEGEAHHEIEHFPEPGAEGSDESSGAAIGDQEEGVFMSRIPVLDEDNSVSMDSMEGEWSPKVAFSDKAPERKLPPNYAIA